MGTLAVTSQIRYGVTSRHVPLYLFTPYGGANQQQLKVACSTPSKENLVVVVERDKSEPPPALGSVSLPRGLLVSVLGPSGDREAELQALKWQACPFPKYPDPGKPAGAWLAKDLEAGRSRVATALATRPPLDWPCTFSIDSEGTGCVDDVVSIRGGGEEGTFELCITIADAACFVAPNTPLDIRARELGGNLYAGTAGGAAAAAAVAVAAAAAGTTTSTSTSATTTTTLYPMLPEVLSQKECSLIPGEARPGVALFLLYNPHKTPALACAREGFSAVTVTNRHAFTYEGCLVEAGKVGLGDTMGVLAAVARAIGVQLGVVGRDLGSNPYTWVEALALFYNTRAGAILSERAGAGAGAGGDSGGGTILTHTRSTVKRLGALLAVDPKLHFLSYDTATLMPISAPLPTISSEDGGGGKEKVVEAEVDDDDDDDDGGMEHLLCWGFDGSAYAPATSPLRKYVDLENQRLLVAGCGGSTAPTPSPLYYSALAHWLNARSRALKSFERDAFFLEAVVVDSLITTTALFLRLEGHFGVVAKGGVGVRRDEGGSGEEEEEGWEEGGGGLGEELRGGGGRGARDLRVTGEFWVPAWKRMLRLKLRPLDDEGAAEEVGGKKVAAPSSHTFLTKDETATFTLTPGQKCTLTAFANLRSKGDWKRSMVFSVSPSAPVGE